MNSGGGGGGGAVFQSLLHDMLLATAHVESCALFRKKDGSVKAASAGYQPTSEQADALQEAFMNSTSARQHGVHFNGATYKCIRADKGSIYAKKEDSGFIAVSTSKLILYGSYSSTMNPSVCVEAVERLGQYLREKGK